MYQQGYRPPQPRQPSKQKPKPPSRMKKAILIALGVLLLFIIIGAVMDADVGAGVLVAGGIGGGAGYVTFLLAKKSQQKKPRTTGSAARTERPQAMPSSLRQPEPRLGCPFVYNNFEKRYSSNNIGVYVPDKSIFANPSFAVGTFLEVRPEPQNQYDASAVALMLQGKIIGYLYKNDRRYDMANDWFKKKLPILAQVESIEADKGGFRVILAFYDESKLERMKRSSPNPKAYKLTRTSGANAQEGISFCCEGEEVSIGSDFDVEGYIITNGTKIGHLPASAARLVDEYGGPESCCAFVAEKGFADNEKETISVYIFKEQ